MCYYTHTFDTNSLTCSSITYIEGKGGGNEVDMKDMEESKADPLCKHLSTNA